MLLFAAVAVVAAPVPKGLKKRPDAEVFVGRWQVVCEENGLPSSEGVWTFDDELKVQCGPADGSPGGSNHRVRFDPNTTPKQIDFGPFRGIYTIDGDDIRIALTVNSDRPASFDPKPGVYDNRLRRLTDNGK